MGGCNRCLVGTRQKTEDLRPKNEESRQNQLKTARTAESKKHQDLKSLNEFDRGLYCLQNPTENRKRRPARVPQNHLHDKKFHPIERTVAVRFQVILRGAGSLFTTLGRVLSKTKTRVKVIDK